MANKITKDQISQNPRDPFRPGVNSPTRLTSRAQNSQVTASNPSGSQLAPVTDGKREYRYPNARVSKSTSDGFAQVARPYREDGRGIPASKMNKRITF